MAVLLRYRYFQPTGGRYHYPAEPGAALPHLSLIYTGAIPTRPGEPTEALLDRLLARHTSDVRPLGRAARPLGTGDVLDLGERGLWQVLSRGFRPIPPEQLRVDGPA